MAARVFKLEELATLIATQLLAISPDSVVKLALTCRALEAPALGALWEKQGSLESLIKRVLPMDIQCYVFPDPEEDLCLLVSHSFAQSASCVLSDRENQIVIAATTHLAGVQ